MNPQLLGSTNLLIGKEFTLLAGVTGIGWILTIYCIWDKFDRNKDKKVYLVKDIVNATFASITLLAAVTISINLSLRLPDLIIKRFSSVR